MAELRVDFDYVTFDESNGRNFKRESATDFTLYMLGVAAASILISVCYWYYSVNIRGLSRYDSTSNALGVLIVAFPTIWVISTYYLTHRDFSGDYGKNLMMDNRRSVILDGDHICYTDSSYFIDYHTSQLKKIVEKDTNVTLKFRRAPDIFIVKSKVVDGDLSELVAQLKSHLK